MPPFTTVDQPNATLVSEHGPVVAASQGSCPTNGTSTNVDWVMMPTKRVGAPRPILPTYLQKLGESTTCTQADDAYGTAEIVVDASGNYAVNARHTTSIGSKEFDRRARPFSCSCSSGVVQCTDKIQACEDCVHPIGHFYYGHGDFGVAGVVQSKITSPMSAISMPWKHI